MNNNQIILFGIIIGAAFFIMLVIVAIPTLEEPNEMRRNIIRYHRDFIMMCLVVGLIMLAIVVNLLYFRKFEDAIREISAVLLEVEK